MAIYGSCGVPCKYTVVYTSSYYRIMFLSNGLMQGSGALAKAGGNVNSLHTASADALQKVKDTGIDIERAMVMQDQWLNNPKDAAKVRKIITSSLNGTSNPQTTHRPCEF